MYNSFDPVDTLIDEIKGTSGFLARIFFTRHSIFAAVVIVGAILAVELFAH